MGTFTVRQLLEKLNKIPEDQRDIPVYVETDESRELVEINFVGINKNNVILAE
jgi:hypothetical protein